MKIKPQIKKEKGEKMGLVRLILGIVFLVTLTVNPSWAKDSKKKSPDQLSGAKYPAPSSYPKPDQVRACRLDCGALSIVSAVPSDTMTRESTDAGHGGYTYQSWIDSQNSVYSDSVYYDVGNEDCKHTIDFKFIYHNNVYTASDSNLGAACRGGGMSDCFVAKGDFYLECTVQPAEKSKHKWKIDAAKKKVAASKANKNQTSGKAAK